MFRTILFTAACLAVGGLQAAELHLRREASPAGALVSLGDVAEILTNDAAEAEQLAKVELFPAPPSGSSRLVRAVEVRDTLAQRGIDLRHVRLVGSSSIWIHGGRAANLPAETAATPAVVPAVAYETITTTTQVVVPLRPLRRGDVIRASDVQLQSREGEAASGVAMNFDDVIGRQVVRPVAQGQLIPLVDLQAPLLVQKNEIVTVYARTRGVQVRTSAKALEPGARGDIIGLESLLERNARFTARVVGTKEVEILAGAPLATSPTPPAAASRDRQQQPSRPRGSLFGLRVRGIDDTSTNGQ
jgi:flagella basal body P-ring formation protein FlgA